MSVRVKEEERLPTLPPLPPYTSEGAGEGVEEGLGEEDTELEGERLTPPLRLPLLEKLRERLTPPDRVTLRDPVGVVVYVDTFPEVPVGAATV